MIKNLHRLKNRKGFTLIELIVVLAIIAVLTVVGVVSSLGGNTQKVQAANSNAKAFLSAAQLTLTRIQLTERSVVTYGATDTKFIEYVTASGNSTGGKNIFIEAKFDQKGIQGIHLDNYFNRVMQRDDSYSDMTALETYIMRNMGEYLYDSYEGYFYCMMDQNFRVTFAHFSEHRLPTYAVGSPLADFHADLMITDGTKVKGTNVEVGSCSDEYITPVTGQFLFNMPAPTDTAFSDYCQ